MKNKFFIALIPFLISANINAKNYANEVIECPSVSAIMAEKFNTADRLENGNWVVGQTNSYYGTKNKWSFVVGNFPANNANEALAKVNTALSSLAYQRGPNSIYDKNVCSYTINIPGVLAAAVTPPCGALIVSK